MGDMKLFSRDVTGKIDIGDADAVCAAVLSIFKNRYEGIDFSPVARLFTDFARLYRGEYPGFFACDTKYHDMQHVLDVTLAAARLIDGYDASQSQPKDCLGGELAMVGVAVALFHDSGYIRRKGDTRHQFGAEYTKTHVSRSARFLAEYLPTTGLSWAASIAAKLVHYTGYEVDPASIDVQDAKQRQVGILIGSADVMAQMADNAYLEKCRDRLFDEFELGGLTREYDADGVERVRYASPTDLLRQTPEFIQRTLNYRLDTLFGSAHNYFCAHFGGPNLYLEAIERNQALLEKLLAQRDEALLLRTPLHI